jgi:PhoD-like phosphatase
MGGGRAARATAAPSGPAQEPSAGVDGGDAQRAGVQSRRLLPGPLRPLARSLAPSLSRELPPPFTLLGSGRRRRIRSHAARRPSARKLFLSVAVVTANVLFAILLLPTAAADGAAPFVWIGNVTEGSFVVHVDVATIGLDAAIERPLLVSADDSLSPTALSVPAAPSFPSPHESIRVYKAGGLGAGTTYHFGFAAGGAVGSVTTFPDDLGAEVVVALSACQRSADRSRSWRRLAEQLPAASNSTAVLMLHAGDLHYENIAENDARKYLEAMSRVVRNNDASRVFSRMQVSYMYDDHDSGPNNSDGSSPSREAVLTNYRRMVPHNSANLSTGALPHSYHAFTVASVRFVFTDLRTEARRADGRMMSEEQLAWFLGELSGADRFSVVVWVSSRPWIAADDSSADDWGGVSPAQRRRISNFIGAGNVTNLVQVAGDMHALAADSGVNSDYSDEGTVRPAGFPVFHSAPLANWGSSKGGPYSEGCHAVRYAINYQYSTLRLYNLGGTPRGPCVSYKGFTAGGGEPKITFDKCGTFAVQGTQGGGQGPHCKIQLLPAWAVAVLVLAIVLVLACIAGGVWICVRRRRRRRRESEVAREE